LRDLVICHDSAFPVADTRHKQDDATVASHSPARQSAGICTATPPDELSPDNEVADTITPAARPPLPDTTYGLPMHPYVPIWAACEKESTDPPGGAPSPTDGRLPRLRVHHYQTYTTKEDGTLRWPGGRHLCTRYAVAGPRRRATHSSGKIGCGPFGYRR
jgi:hypothetical protein